MSRRAEHIETAIAYHERTEHRFPNRYAASLGYMDWAMQPDPFREYHGSRRIELPLCEPQKDTDPSWAELRSQNPQAAETLSLASLADLLYHSMAISAWKRAGNSAWALRCNPSSGNLHPTEGYLLTGPVEGLSEQPALFHYAPSQHALELRRSLDPCVYAELAKQLPAGAFLFGLSSIVWREAWKYGERAFRYCMQDVGHAMQAIAVAARILGWRVRRVEGLDAMTLDRLLALEANSGPEAEHADLLLAVETVPTATQGPLELALPESLLTGLCPPAVGKPNALSAEHKDWPVVAEVEEATRDQGESHGDVDLDRENSAGFAPSTSLPSSPSARRLVRQRRSAVAFDGGSEIRPEQLYAMLRTLLPALTPSLWTAFPQRQRVHPVVYLHRIDDLEPGLAILVRDPSAGPALRAAITEAREWSKLPGCPEDLPFYRLTSGEVQEAGRAVHCHQDIGADGALVVSMLGAFDGELQEFGAAAWRYLHWEAGAIGQLLYLEAEAIERSATGIGCFFDQAVHKLLGLQDGSFRMLYGTAVGKAVSDPRVQTLPAYQR